MARRKKADSNAKNVAKKFFAVIVFLAVIVFAVKQTIFFFTHAEIFKVKEIVRAPSLQHVDSQYLDHIVGRNIFEIDLYGIQRRVQAQYSSIDNLRIARQLPNRIHVSAEKREPFALAVIARAEVVIDGYGVVLDDQPFAMKSLPLIVGIHDVGSVPPGDKIRSRQLGVALKILNVMAGHPYLSGIRVRTMDVTNVSKIMLALENRGDIIMDGYQVEEKLGQLGVLLSQPDLDFKNIAYIDLRFKTPIASKGK